MPTTAQPRHAPEGATLRPGKHPCTPIRSARATGPLIAIAHRLQPRDLTLALLLDQHQLLTTAQIAAILFGSPVTAVHRLRVLRRLGFLDRLIRQQAGAPPLTCWIPGALSARYAALADGRPPPTVKVLRDAQDRILANPHLDHLIGANQFHIDLLAHARTQPGTRLVRWWSARRTAAVFAHKIQPDGHGIWTIPGGQVGYWLEHDESTEPLPRLISKLAAYRRLRAEGGPGYPVLFWLGSRRRETNLHYRLAEHDTHGVIVATAARDSLDGASPAAAVWRLFGTGRRRLTLPELPSHPGQSGSLNPALRADDDPLYSLGL
ncbi:MAG TPA: replication-relaxation family protein [Planosporangium sp.]|nr:replication-relaxation family protein [Planosporangium sp.]